MLLRINLVLVDRIERERKAFGREHRSVSKHFSRHYPLGTQ